MNTAPILSSDSRFFPGYTWVSDHPDCRLGLSMPGTDPMVAARVYLGDRLAYYNCGRSFVVWTMGGPGEVARRVEIVA